MKKKIIIGLGIFSLLFLVGGVYAIATIEHATAKLDNLIRLHQVEILREHLLIQIKRAQSDLYLKNTRHARSIDTVVAHVRSVDAVLTTCFECHHAAEVKEKLDGLKTRTEEYKNALSRVFTIRANAARRAAEEENAHRIGADLISEVNAITSLTSMKLEERTQAAFREIARTKIILYGLLTAVPVVALAFSVVFLRGFTKPVTELLTATRRIKGGDLDYRIRGLADEYGEVAASFNEMARSLTEHCAKMQWAEQIVVLGELAGGLAHEIKNPLAGIKASMEVLSADPSIPAESRDILRKVIDQIRKIETLLKSLLNFARPPKPQFMRTDVNGVLDATISLALKHPLYSSRDGRPIAIVKEFARGLPETMADPLQLQQVFINLLLNAADALPEGGTVTAKTLYDESSRSLVVRITDTGAGIDERLVDKIFLPFFTTKSKGTGLGLSITKRLVEQHGGGIRVESRPGSGATFVITLPVTDAKGVHGP